MKKHHWIISPLTLIGFPWFVTIVLYQFKLTDNLVDLDFGLVLTFLLMSLFFTLATLTSIKVSHKSIKISEKNLDCNTSKMQSVLRLLIIIWFSGSVFDIWYSGGLPFIWALTGIDKNYTDFGAPSFHGLINSFYFALMGTVFLLFKQTDNRRYLLYTAILFMWPILMLGRGIMLSVAVQLCIISVFYSGARPKKVLFLIFLALLTVVAFGLLGDLRGSENPFFGIIKDEYKRYFEMLPSGFLWVYIYITSPLSNLAHNYLTLTPVWEFYYSSVNLFPTFLRPSSLDRADNFVFVNEGLNVSTIFASSHSDFGVAGDIILLLILALWTGFWFRRLTKNSVYILPYSLVGVVLFFSIFYNLFLLYPYLFSTVLLGVIAKYIKN